jgi:hypothetical protein
MELDRQRVTFDQEGTTASFCLFRAMSSRLYKPIVGDVFTRL